MNRFAEDANYFDTTVHPAKSQGEIMELLENFGADQIMVVQGQTNGRFAWMIRFQWRDHTYRFTFTPLICREPQREKSFGGKRRTYQEQTKYQMGRVAAWFVKAILIAAELQPDALFGFIELPAMAKAAGALPPTTAELDVSVLSNAVPLMPDVPLLVEGEIVDEEVAL